MPGSFRGGSGPRDVGVGRREMRESVRRGQGILNKEFTEAAEREFRNSGLVESDLGEPSGSTGKYLVKDVREAVEHV